MSAVLGEAIPEHLQHTVIREDTTCLRLQPLPSVVNGSLEDSEICTRCYAS